MITKNLLPLLFAGFAFASTSAQAAIRINSYLPDTFYLVTHQTTGATPQIVTYVCIHTLDNCAERSRRSLNDESAQLFNYSINYEKQDLANMIAQREKATQELAEIAKLPSSTQSDLSDNISAIQESYRDGKNRALYLTENLARIEPFFKRFVELAKPEAVVDLNINLWPASDNQNVNSEILRTYKINFETDEGLTASTAAIKEIIRLANKSMSMPKRVGQLDVALMMSSPELFAKKDSSQQASYFASVKQDSYGEEATLSCRRIFGEGFHFPTPDEFSNNREKWLAVIPFLKNLGDMKWVTHYGHNAYHYFTKGNLNLGKYNDNEEPAIPQYYVFNSPSQEKGKFVNYTGLFMIDYLNPFIPPVYGNALSMCVREVK